MLLVWPLATIVHVKPLLLGELLRHRDDEHAGLPAGQEMRRLAQVGPAGLDPVVRADRNVERLRRNCD